MDRNGLAAVPGSASATSPGASSGGFSVRRLIDERRYDLREAGVDAVGSVPFPSHEARQRFFEDLDEIWNEAREKAKAEAGGDRQGEDDKSFEEAFIDRPNLFSETFGGREEHDRFVEIAARLTNGHPTKEQLEALPPDVFSAFFEWLLGLMAPKTSGVSGTV